MSTAPKFAAVKFAALATISLLIAAGLARADGGEVAALLKKYDAHVVEVLKPVDAKLVEDLKTFESRLAEDGELEAAKPPRS